MRILLIVALTVAGCVSEETRQLAQGTNDFQKLMVPRVRALADFALEKGAMTPKQHAKMAADQEALSVATRSLREILGQPKVPVEVDSW